MGSRMIYTSCMSRACRLAGGHVAHHDRRSHRDARRPSRMGETSQGLSGGCQVLVAMKACLEQSFFGPKRPIPEGKLAPAVEYDEVDQACGACEWLSWAARPSWRKRSSR